MKVNLPVTEIERPFPKGETIISKTDLKGAITYANDTFIKISGFTQEELLGKNHNLVGHPEMPPEAFADLWATVRAGKPWRGIVKNRCKDGDYYWVKAPVVPVRENDQTSGYMSVRTEPTAAEKRSAAARYQAITRSAVASMETAIERVREGRGLIEQTHQSFQDITASSRRVTEFSTGIAEAAQQQSAAAAEVAGNTEQIAHLIDENDASIVQVRDTVAESSRTADHLRGVVEHFRVNG